MREKGKPCNVLCWPDFRFIGHVVWVDTTRRRASTNSRSRVRSSAHQPNVLKKGSKDNDRSRSKGFLIGVSFPRYFAHSTVARGYAPCMRDGDLSEPCSLDMAGPTSYDLSGGGPGNVGALRLITKQGSYLSFSVEVAAKRRFVLTAGAAGRLARD